MPTNGPNGIEIKIGGDATPLERTIEEAKAKVEVANAEASASTAAAPAAAQAAAEVKKIETNAKQASESIREIGTSAEKAVGPTSNAATGLKGLNKTLGDTVGQVQSLIGKLTMVVGTATGMFALGRVIRESVISSLETGTEKAEKFAESLDLSKKADSIKAISDEINKLSGELTAQETNGLDRAVGFFTGTNPEKLKEEITRLNKLAKSLRDSEQAERRRKEREEAAKAAAEAEEQARKQAEALAEIERKEAERAYEQERREAERAQKDKERDLERERKATEDHNRRMIEMANELAEREAAAARKVREEWTNALYAIRDASNAVFGSNRVVGDAGMAQAVESIGTRANAARSRMVFEGGN